MYSASVVERATTNYILGMEIKRDQEKRKLYLNQRNYVETILQMFNMQDSKPVNVPIPVGVKLSSEQCPKTQEEEEYKIGRAHV